MNPYENKLRAACDQLGLHLDAIQITKLLTYLEQLKHWNRVYNLTALHTLDQMLVQHIFDSLAIVKPLDALMPELGRLYDVGAGAGLPGLILSIMRPTWTIYCIEAVRKKAAFVRQMCGVLSLPNLHSVHARVEQLEPAGCDVVTARAFASLSDFASVAGYHLRPGGTLVALKGKKPDEEITELHAKTAWRVVQIDRIVVPALQAQRCLVWMRRLAVKECHESNHVP